MQNNKLKEKIPIILSTYTEKAFTIHYPSMMKMVSKLGMKRNHLSVVLKSEIYVPVKLLNGKIFACHHYGFLDIVPCILAKAVG